MTCFGHADEEGWNEEQPWLSDVDAYSNAGKPSLEQMQKMLEGLPQNEETQKIKDMLAALRMGT